MIFEWDEKKNQLNRLKHKIGFEAAWFVFDDPYALTVFDQVVDFEERWRTMGLVGGAIVLMVVHTYRGSDGEETIRIISVRKATASERKRYEENRKASG